MCVRVFPYLIFVIFSIKVVCVHNYFLQWGGSDSTSIDEKVEADLNAVGSTAINAAADLKEDVEEAAAEVGFGFSSFFDRVNGKLQNMRANIRNMFDFDDDIEASYYLNQILALPPQQFGVIQNLLNNWSSQAASYAENELELRKRYLDAAKDDLYNTMMAFREGNYDTAMNYFKSAMINVRDESAIYRAIQYALNQDQSMIPLVSELSYSILDQIEFDLSNEG